MFDFHERTKRRLCRAGFFGFCVLPILALCFWTASIHLPSSIRSASLEWSQRLGMRVTVGRVTYPRPGAKAFESVSLAGPHSDVPIATVGRIQLMPHRQSDGYLLQLHDVQIHVDGLGDVAMALSHILGHHDGEATRYLVADRVQINASDKTIPSEPLVMKEWQMRPVPPEGDGGGIGSGSGIKCQGRIDREGSSNTIHLAMSHAHDSVDSGVKIEWNTGVSWIPCWAMAAFVPLARSLGPEATFRGAGSMEWSAKRSIGQLSGQLQHVDFGRLSKILPIHFPGANGMLSFQRICWNGDRLEEAYGAVRGGPGTVQQRLLDAATRALFCQQPQERLGEADSATKAPARQPSAPESSDRQPSDPLDSDRAIPFDEMALRFALDAAGLTLWGTCETAAQGTIIARDGQVILGEPPYRRLPVANLVYLFAPQVQYYIPATREAQAIANQLPLSSDATIQ